MFKFLKDSWQEARRRVDEEDKARAAQEAAAQQAGAQPSGAQPPAANPGLDMPGVARDLAANLAKRGIELDFTPTSLALMDPLLAATKKQLAVVPEAKRRTSEGIGCLNIGSYVGEVLRRAEGGVWVKGDAGLPVLDLGGHLVPVVTAVFGFLHHGKVDMPGGPVTTIAAYGEAILQSARAWIDTIVCGTYPDLASLQREMSDEAALAAWLTEQAMSAVKTGRAKYDLPLDFSPESLEGVESVLAHLHDHLKDAAPEERPSDKTLDAVAIVWGVYIGEVIRRRYGGKWTVSKPDGVLELDINGSRVFPVRKAQKRLLDGPGDAIPFYFRGIGAALSQKLVPLDKPSGPF